MANNKIDSILSRLDKALSGDKNAIDLSMLEEIRKDSSLLKTATDKIRDKVKDLNKDMNDLNKSLTKYISSMSSSDEINVLSKIKLQEFKDLLNSTKGKFFLNTKGEKYQGLDSENLAKIQTAYNNIKESITNKQQQELDNFTKKIQSSQDIIKAEKEQINQILQYLEGNEKNALTKQIEHSQSQIEDLIKKMSPRKQKTYANKIAELQNLRSVSKTVSGTGDLEKTVNEQIKQLEKELNDIEKETIKANVAAKQKAKKNELTAPEISKIEKAETQKINDLRDKINNAVNNAAERMSKIAAMDAKEKKEAQEAAERALRKHQEALEKKKRQQEAKKYINSKLPRENLVDKYRTKKPKGYKEPEIKPLEVTADTGVEIINGQKQRQHKYKVSSKDKSVKNLPMYSPSQISSLFYPYLGKYSGTGAADYGTAHHRIIEGIIKKEIPLEADGSISKENLARFIVKLKKGSLEDQEDVKSLFDTKTGKIKSTEANNLLRTSNQFLQLAKVGNIPLDKLQSEVTKGMTVETTSGKINIGGTMDLLWATAGGLQHIGDLKTSARMTPEYLLQLSLYRMILRANGMDVDENLQIVHTPRAATARSAGNFSMRSLREGQLQEILNIFALFQEMQNKEGTDQEWNKERKEALNAAIQEWRKKQGFANMNLVADKVEFPDQNDPTQTRSIWTIGGSTINDWMKFIDDYGLGAEGVDSLINNIVAPSGKDEDSEILRKKFRRLFTARSGTGFLYSQGPIKEWREKNYPWMANIGSKEWYEKYSGMADMGEAGQYQPGSYIAGMSISQWKEAYDAATTEEEKENIINSLVYSLESNLEEPNNAREAEKYVIASKFIRGLISKPDDYQVDKELETVQEQIEKIKSKGEEIPEDLLNRLTILQNKSNTKKSYEELIGKLTNKSSILSQIYKNLTSSNLGEGNMFTNSRASQLVAEAQERLRVVPLSETGEDLVDKMKADQLKAKAENELNEEDLSPSDQFSKLSQLLGRSFAAEEIYKRVYKEEFEKFKKEHPDSPLTEEEFMQRSLSRKQRNQLESSSLFREWAKKGGYLTGKPEDIRRMLIDIANSEGWSLFGKADQYLVKGIKELFHKNSESFGVIRDPDTNKWMVNEDDQESIKGYKLLTGLLDETGQGAAKSKKALLLDKPYTKWQLLSGRPIETIGSKWGVTEEDINTSSFLRDNNMDPYLQGLNTKIKEAKNFLLAQKWLKPKGYEKPEDAQKRQKDIDDAEAKLNKLEEEKKRYIETQGPVNEYWQGKRGYQYKGSAKNFGTYEHIYLDEIGIEQELQKKVEDQAATQKKALEEENNKRQEEWNKVIADAEEEIKSDQEQAKKTPVITPTPVARKEGTKADTKPEIKEEEESQKKKEELEQKEQDLQDKYNEIDVNAAQESTKSFITTAEEYQKVFGDDRQSDESIIAFANLPESERQKVFEMDEARFKSKSKKAATSTVETAAARSQVVIPGKTNKDGNNVDNDLAELDLSKNEQIRKNHEQAAEANIMELEDKTQELESKVQSLLDGQKNFSPKPVSQNISINPDKINKLEIDNLDKITIKTDNLTVGDVNIKSVGSYKQTIGSQASIYRNEGSASSKGGVSSGASGGGNPPSDDELIKAWLEGNLSDTDSVSAYKGLYNKLFSAYKNKLKYIKQQSKFVEGSEGYKDRGERIKQAQAELENIVALIKQFDTSKISADDIADIRAGYSQNVKDYESDQNYKELGITKKEYEKQRKENLKKLKELYKKKLQLEQEISQYLKAQEKFAEGSEGYKAIENIVNSNKNQLGGISSDIEKISPLVDEKELQGIQADYESSKSKDVVKDEQQNLADKKKALKELDAYFSQRTSLRYDLAKYQKRYNLTSPLSREIPYLEEYITNQSVALEDLEEKIAEFIKENGFTEEDLSGLNKKYSDKDIRNQLLVGMSHQGSQNLFQKIGTSFKNMLENFTQMGAAYKIIGMLRNAMGKIVTAAQQLDKAMVDLRIVTGNTKEETNELMSSYSKLGGELSATTTEVANAANSWLRQGYSIGEVNDLISASMHLSKLGMIESGQATAYLTSMLKGFKLEASDAMDVVSKLTKVDMEAATSAGSIAESLRQFATTAQLSGVDIDQAIAMATTIMDVSQKDASSVGHALNTMIARYGNVKAGAYTKANLGEESSDTTEKLNDIEKVLNKIGISMRTTSLEFRDFDEVLEDVADKWQDLDNVSQNAIA